MNTYTPWYGEGLRDRDFLLACGGVLDGDLERDRLWKDADGGETEPRLWNRGEGEGDLDLRRICWGGDFDLDLELLWYGGDSDLDLDLDLKGHKEIKKKKIAGKKQMILDCITSIKL